MRRALAIATCALVAGCGGGSSRPSPTPTRTPTTVAAADCPDVELVFARGTGERQGLGAVGAPLLLELRQALPRLDVGAYAVRYGAVTDQSSAGPGATDLTRHVESRARACPDLRFVVGGYSQGASVTDIALGMPAGLGAGDAIPARLAGRVAAVVVFGNPARLRDQRLDRDGGVYADKALDDCNRGDPICKNGDDFSQHLAYRADGSVDAAVRFVQRRVRAAP